MTREREIKRSRMPEWWGDKSCQIHEAEGIINLQQKWLRQDNIVVYA